MTAPEVFKGAVCECGFVWPAEDSITVRLYSAACGFETMDWDREEAEAEHADWDGDICLHKLQVRDVAGCCENTPECWGGDPELVQPMTTGLYVTCPTCDMDDGSMMRVDGEHLGENCDACEGEPCWLREHREFVARQVERMPA